MLFPAPSRGVSPHPTRGVSRVEIPLIMETAYDAYDSSPLLEARHHFLHPHVRRKKRSGIRTRINIRL